MRLDFPRAHTASTLARVERVDSRERRRAASNIQDFTDGVSHACHTSRYTGSLLGPPRIFSRSLSLPTPPARSAGSASHLADLATARVEHPPLFRAFDVFHVA